MGRPFGHEHWIEDVAFSPDGTLVLTCSADRTAQLWSVDTGQPIGPPLEHQLEIYDGAFSPDGKRVVTGGGRGEVKLWDVPTPVEGPLDQVSMWIRALTGMEMDEHGVVSWIENSEWQELRRRVDARGGG